MEFLLEFTTEVFEDGQLYDPVRRPFRVVILEAPDEEAMRKQANEIMDDMEKYYLELKDDSSFDVSITPIDVYINNLIENGMELLDDLAEEKVSEETGGDS